MKQQTKQNYLAMLALFLLVFGAGIADWLLTLTAV